MFQVRDLPDDLDAVREAHAPDAIVVDAASDFKTVPSAQAEDLGLIVDSLDPYTAPAEWLPEDAPTVLRRYAGSDFTIGLPGDGSIAWTHQTDPPVILVKPRVQGSPEGFVDFLIAEALVEVGLDAPEGFLGFFGERYRDLDAATDLGPNGTYQIAAALYDGWLGLQTRDVFAEWIDTRPRLGEAWQDAGQRIEGRLSGLPGAMARGDTDFPDATELACSSIKHALELPAPYTALDTDVYRDRGAEYGVAWAEKTFERR